MATILLAAGTSFVPFGEWPELIAKAIHPAPSPHDGDAESAADLAGQQAFLQKAGRKRQIGASVFIMEWELAAAEIRDELTRAVREGRLTVHNPLTLAAYTKAPRGAALEGALIAVAELGTLLKDRHIEVTHSATTTVSKRWTDEFKAEVRAYKETHGLKKTAEHYDVSEGTIGKHVPAKKRTPTPLIGWGQLKKHADD